MVAPNHRFKNSSIEVFSSDENERQLNQNINNNENQSLNSLALNIDVDQDFITTTEMFVLHNCVKEWCRVSEDDCHLWIGSMNNSKRMSLGPIDEWTQRRSVTQDLTLNSNGLKPIKGSANKFTVNQINQINQSISETECEIEFTNRNAFCGQFPISEDCKIIATNRGSQLFIVHLPYNQSNEVIGIRPNDGFVLVHSKLSVYNTPKPIDHIQTNCDNNDNNELRPFYDESQNGHLFILGEGGHLLLIDKRNDECVLLVGIGGLDLFSLFDARSYGRSAPSLSQKPDNKSRKDPINGINSLMDRSITSSSESTNTGRQVNSFNPNESCNKSAENKSKRQLSPFEGQTKKQKYNFSPLMECVMNDN